MKQVAKFSLFITFTVIIWFTGYYTGRQDQLAFGCEEVNRAK